jgi:cell division protein FtsL
MGTACILIGLLIFLLVSAVNFSHTEHVHRNTPEHEKLKEVKEKPNLETKQTFKLGKTNK